MMIQSVTGSNDFTMRTIDAYVDDANHGVNDRESQECTNHIELLNQLDHSSQQLERILYITGGNLNLQKCFCWLLMWYWACETPHSTSVLNKTGDIEITNSVTGTRSTIKQLESHQAFKLLGVWVQLHE